MYKIFNQFTGVHETVLTLNSAKVRFNELLGEIIGLSIKHNDAHLPNTSQPWATEVSVAENSYFSFFGDRLAGKYYYTIFDVTHGTQVARNFYFINDAGDDTLVKVSGLDTLEIYHRLVNSGKSISYDIQTKQPLFYYTNDSLTKYDYNTDAVLSVTTLGTDTIPIEILRMLDNYPQITNIFTHAQKDYGYIVEYVEPSLTEPININTLRKLVSVVYETYTLEGLMGTEIIDTSTWYTV